MQLPIVAYAPIVSEHAQAFRHLFNDVRQYQNFQNYLTGLIVLENKSLANISRCILNSADKSNLSRFMGEAPWQPTEVNRFRIEYVMGQTIGVRMVPTESYFILDDPLCEHVGSLFEYVDRHYDHCDGSYPLAHNLVTSHYLSGAVRIPISAEVYQRYETVTRWEEFILKHFPDQEIPKTAALRAKVHKQRDAQLLQDPEFWELHQLLGALPWSGDPTGAHPQFRTKIEIAQKLVAQAVTQGLPFTTMLMDSWYLTPALVKTLADLHIDWVSLLKRNRKLETGSFQLTDAQGKPHLFAKPYVKVEDLVPLIPPHSYKKVEIQGQTYWCFTLCVRLEGLGKVRLTISFDNPELTGTYAVLITNRCDWSATQMLAKYLLRWTIETSYRDSKQLLGLDEYRTRSFLAIDAHWCLVFVAYSLLHLACLPLSSTQGSGQRPTVPSQSIGSVCRQQGQALIERLILFAHDSLLQGCSAADLFSSLFSKQQPLLA
jgi:SRSO17 transposase